LYRKLGEHLVAKGKIEDVSNHSLTTCCNLCN
jgi:hypothetical protein